jgi:hypothetical protein
MVVVVVVVTVASDDDDAMVMVVVMMVMILRDLNSVGSTGCLPHGGRIDRTQRRQRVRDRIKQVCVALCTGEHGLGCRGCGLRCFEGRHPGKRANDADADNLLVHISPPLCQ